MNKRLYYSIPGFLLFLTIVFAIYATNSKKVAETPKVLHSIHEHTHADGSTHSHGHNQPSTTYDKQLEMTIDVDYRDQGGYRIAQATINGEPFFLDIADTPTLLQRGLSYRKELREGTGMIFVFDQKNLHGIWMKDMNFPIDIVWVNKDRSVVHVEFNVSPDTYPEVFTSLSPADYVIELPAGTWTSTSTISW